MTEPKPGDRVRVTYEAIWDQDRGTHYWMRDITAGTTASVPNTATVEVIEPADDLSQDPSQDPVGTVRRSPDGRVAHRVDGTRCPWQEYIDDFTDYDWRYHDDVTGWEVIGAAPGTPAWDDWRKGELRGAPEFPSNPPETKYELWTGDGCEEPPLYVYKVRDADGDEIERRGNGWAFLTVYGRVVEHPVQSIWEDLDPEAPLIEVID